jgi:hypothetical protein
MLTSEKHARVTHIADRLIELYVERDQACIDGDWRRARELQAEIDETAAQRREIIDHP